MSPYVLDVPGRVLRLLAKRGAAVEREMERYLPRTGSGGGLFRAMRYSVFAGGKRVRPFLVLEAARMCGGNDRRAMPLACAVEMIHTYSLIHDDLPAMDDDAMRRGKPSCHKKFGEAAAILAGDALLTLAFEVMADAGGTPPERRTRAVGLVSQAVGPRGMVEGQALDLAQKNADVSLPLLERINRRKTGCLIAVCLEAGSVWGGGSAAEAADLRRYGEAIGFLFQVVDDIIDREGYARVLGGEGAYEKASALKEEAKRYLGRFGKRADMLRDFADYLYDRSQ